MAGLPRTLAAAIVARYPRAWRGRYADEMLALIEDRGTGWWDVIDLARECSSEWRISISDPETHPVALPALFANGSALRRAQAEVDCRIRELELARENLRGSVRLVAVGPRGDT